MRMMDSSKRDFIPDLPGDLFLLVILYLAPPDAVRCRRVSRSWRAAFEADAVCRRLIREHFPRCRELRVTPNCSAAASYGSPCSWSRTFTLVARRYYHLRSARPRVVEKIEKAREHAFIPSSFQAPAPPSPRSMIDVTLPIPPDQAKSLPELSAAFSFREVEPWWRSLHWNDHLAPFQHRDAVWTMDDGLLVYPEVYPEEKENNMRQASQSPNVSRGGRYVVYDLETTQRLSVPFDVTDKTVRRVRLSCGVLIFEWCEREPYHKLNAQENVHRHFVTAFDIRKRAGGSPSAAPAASTSTTPTSSNTPLSSSARRSDVSSANFPAFKAAPSPPTIKSSDAMPSRPRASILRSGPPTPDQATWTVTFRSEWKLHFLGLPLNGHDRFFSTHTATHYALYLWQPNRSPWGEDDPLEQLAVWDISFPSAYRPSQDPTGSHAPDPDLAPIVVRRFSWRELDHLGVRQRHTPSLRSLVLDERNVYIHEEDHRWLVGSQANPSLPRHHHVRSIGFPFDGLGPRWVDECCADGDVHMSFCPRAGRLFSGQEPRSSGNHDESANNVDGGSESNDYDYHHDDGDGDHVEVDQQPEINGGGSHHNEINRSRSRRTPYHQGVQVYTPPPPPDRASPTLWPGLAPCWRHEEFPYLTVCDVVDIEAGVRFAARQCFMMETLSVFVLDANPLPPNHPHESEEGDDDDDNHNHNQDPPALETLFEDSMWNKLVSSKGKLAGDERWLVGEDVEGYITVVRF